MKREALKKEIVAYIVGFGTWVTDDLLRARFPVSTETLEELFEEADPDIFMAKVQGKLLFCPRMRLPERPDKWDLLKQWLKEHNKVSGEGYAYVLKKMGELEKA